MENDEDIQILGFQLTPEFRELMDSEYNAMLNKITGILGGMLRQINDLTGTMTRLEDRIDNLEATVNKLESLVILITKCIELSSL